MLWACNEDGDDDDGDDDDDNDDLEDDDDDDDEDDDDDGDDGCDDDGSDDGSGGGGGGGDSIPENRECKPKQNLQARTQCAPQYIARNAGARAETSKKSSVFNVR